MKSVVLKARPKARGSIGELGVLRAKLADTTKSAETSSRKKVVLKPRPTARGSVGQLGLLRAKPVVGEKEVVKAERKDAGFHTVCLSDDE